MDNSCSKLTQDILRLMKDIGVAVQNESKLPYVMHREGWRLPVAFSLECVDYAMNEWKIPENSVIIASFPKTGTMWCMEIVRQIMYGNDDELLNKSKSLPQIGHLIEMGQVYKFTDIYQELPIPRKFFFTHLPAELLNFEKIKQSNSKIISMCRNPKDQAVSWYYFLQKLKPSYTKEQTAQLLGEGWNDFIVRYISGVHAMGLKEGQWYPDHLGEWIRRVREHDNTLLVEFESLKRDFKSETRRIAKFLDVELSEEDVTKVYERCTIDSMKSKTDQEIDGSEFKFMQKNIRKGEVGGWKNYFTVAESELVDRLVEEKLSDIGVKFTYEL